jgi:uncharacterized repeat protein (TIGR01451 family)
MLALPSRILDLPPFFRLLLLTLTFFFSGTIQSAVLDFVEAEATDGGLHDIAISPDGNFVYVYELHPQDDSRINIYSRNETNGELEFISATQVLDGSTEFSLLKGLGMSPDGNNLYAVGSIDEPFGTGIFWFDRDSASGQLSYGGRLMSAGTTSDFDGLGNPSGTIAFSPDGSFVYAGDIGGSGAIVTFQRAGNGVLTWVETISDDFDNDNLTSITDIQVSSDGNSLYAVSLQGNRLYGFSRNQTTGLLTMLQHFNSNTNDPANGIPGLDDAEQSVISRDGRFLYAVGNIDNDSGTGNDDRYNVVIFQRDPSNGTLTYQSNAVNTALHGSNPEYETLYWPTTVILSPDEDQRFLYTGSQISDAINVFRRDSDDGSLSWVGWATDGVGEVSLNSVQQIVISPDGQFIYAASDDGGDIAVFDTRADLSLVKTDDIDPIQPSGTLTYTLAVTNNGPADAQNLVITDTLPTGVTYLNGSLNMPGGSCSENDGTVNCTLSSLAASAGVTATLEVTAPTSEGSISNTATVSADQIEVDNSNDSDSEETTVSASGDVTPPEDDGSDSEDDSSSGGGGSLDPLSMLLLSLALPLLSRRFRYKQSR